MASFVSPDAVRQSLQPSRRRALARWSLVALASALALAGGTLLSACSAIVPREKVKLTVVGLELLGFQALELRLALKLRVENPNDVALDYDGLVFELAVNGRPLASGVTAAKGSVPRFGEAVLTIPVSVSSLEAWRQLKTWAHGHSKGESLPYVLRGKLGAGWLGQLAFEHKGSLALPR